MRPDRANGTEQLSKILLTFHLADVRDKQKGPVDELLRPARSNQLPQGVTPIWGFHLTVQSFNQKRRSSGNN